MLSREHALSRGPAGWARDCRANFEVVAVSMKASKVSSFARYTATAMTLGLANAFDQNAASAVSCTGTQAAISGSFFSSAEP